MKISYNLEALPRGHKKSSKTVLLLCIIFVIFVSCLSCFLVCSLPAGKGLTSWLSCIRDVFLCFCHFPMWCPGSGVVLNCIDS